MRSKVGEKYITNEGYKIEIIEYFSFANCTIRFEDDTKLNNVRFDHIKNGSIRNPFHKSVIGVGYLGEGTYKTKEKGKMTSAYNTWCKMLERCYSEKFRIKYPTYKDVTVCEKWHNFQNFAKWFEENYVEGFHLDKDILCKNCKIYSPETCCFVPQEINNLFTVRSNYRGDYPIGILKRGSMFHCRINKTERIFIGSFHTVEEAFQAYKKAKESYIKEIANKYKLKIIEACYKVLINYKIKIND